MYKDNKEEKISEDDVHLILSVCRSANYLAVKEDKSNKDKWYIQTVNTSNRKKSYNKKSMHSKSMRLGSQQLYQKIPNQSTHIGYSKENRMVLKRLAR